MEIIDKILTNFDFDVVVNIMTFLDWRWGSAQKVPTKEQIQEVARQLLTELKEHESIDYIATGGLIASKYQDEYGNITYKLSFEVVEWEESISNYLLN